MLFIFICSIEYPLDLSSPDLILAKIKNNYIKTTCGIVDYYFESDTDWTLVKLYHEKRSISKISLTNKNEQLKSSLNSFFEKLKVFQLELDDIKLNLLFFKRYIFDYCEKKSAKINKKKVLNYSQTNSNSCKSQEETNFETSFSNICFFRNKNKKIIHDSDEDLLVFPEVNKIK
jgi:hypothetical protein